MKEPTPNELAQQIQKRVNALSISISRLCRDAGVDRKWFENFKKRNPKAIQSYLNIERQLSVMEKEKENGGV